MPGQTAGLFIRVVIILGEPFGLGQFCQLILSFVRTSYFLPHTHSGFQLPMLMPPCIDPLVPRLSLAFGSVRIVINAPLALVRIDPQLNHFRTQHLHCLLV